MVALIIASAAVWVALPDRAAGSMSMIIASTLVATAISAVIATTKKTLFT
jgi:hypothetical protein